MTRYERIGGGYARTRREDPRIAALISNALGEARTVVNVGAGTGSYEPLDRHVIAVEPSDRMAAQRANHRAPAIAAFAHELPLRDHSVDAAMAVLTIHHWDEHRDAGIAELRRVARGPVVIVTIDPSVSGRMWLMADYLHEVAALDDQIFPPMDHFAELLGPDTSTSVIPIHRSSEDWSLVSFWAHPERVLDPDARAATSGFARMPEAVVQRVVADVERDLANGAWDRKHGKLRTLDAFDAGLRLVVSPRPLDATATRR